MRKASSELEKTVVSASDQQGTPNNQKTNSRMLSLCWTAKLKKLVREVSGCPRETHAELIHNPNSKPAATIYFAEDAFRWVKGENLMAKSGALLS